MKISRALSCVLAVAVAVLVLKPVAAQARVTTQTIFRGQQIEICRTRNVSQWITVEATGQIGIIMYAKNSNIPLWDSAWSGEYLDYLGGVGYTAYAYNHRFWCGSDVYRIEAYIVHTGGGGLHPAVATYVTSK